MAVNNNNATAGAGAVAVANDNNSRRRSFLLTMSVASLCLLMGASMFAVNHVGVRVARVADDTKHNAVKENSPSQLSSPADTTMSCVERKNEEVVSAAVTPQKDDYSNSNNKVRNVGDDKRNGMSDAEYSKWLTEQLESYQKPGYKKHPHRLMDTYTARGKPIDESERKALTAKFGSWTFSDPQPASSRPDNDYYAAYPNRDVPRDAFPANAWQLDKQYMEGFLTQSKHLVERSMESILTEYGYGRFDEPGQSFEERSHMFSLLMTDQRPKLKRNAQLDVAGWMPKESFQGLVRRVLHAVMTQDSFVVVMGGHSSAAGHGNIFQLTYTMQIQRVLEPVFARLGVAMEARNMGMGGMGTLQNGFSPKDIYGPDIDMLVHDSGMTEKEPQAHDVFFRQAMLGCDRVPVLWSDFAAMPTLETFRQHVGADIGQYGYSMSGIKQTVDNVQVNDLPWASRYVSCSPEMRTTCRSKEYGDSTCWIDRPDVTPPTKQKPMPGGRAGWHPGCFYHQLRGRGLAFIVLHALQGAITTWLEAPDYRLNDEQWHVTQYYQNIKDKVKALDKSVGSCYLYNKIPERVWKNGLSARTEFTPRYDPEMSSMRSIMKNKNEQFLAVPPNAYDPPDVRIPALDAPDGVFDYLVVMENGDVPFLPLMGRRRKLEAMLNQYKAGERGGHRRLVEQDHETRELSNDDDANKITPGKGFLLECNANSDSCDGTYDSWCGRGRERDCLLYGHNDRRGGIHMDYFSGWFVFNIPRLEQGFIMIQNFCWGKGSISATAGFKCEENSYDRPCPDTNPAMRHRRAGVLAAGNNTLAREEERASRRLGGVKDYCDDFKLDVAINGKIVRTMNRDEYNEAGVLGQRVAHFWILFDDPSFPPTDNVEFAFRMRGCDRSNRSWQITHLYWL